MLAELKPITQVKGEPKRRFFIDEDSDLYVWFDEAGAIVGFQLSYDKKGNYSALTWWEDKGFCHDRIDDGEVHPLQPKATPILIPDGAFNKQAVAACFTEASKGLEERITKFVLERISHF
jgi:hypothetical protein